MKRITINDVANYEESSFVIESLIPMNSVTIIGAAPKMGKSQLALNMVLANIHEINFLGGKTSGIKVCYFTNELSANQLIYRISRTSSSMNENLEFYEDLASMKFDRIEEVIQSKVHEGFGLFVVDTLIKVKYKKSYNLNNYDEMYEVISMYQKLATENQCAIILLHHTKKNNKGGAVSEKLMGSQAIGGAVDTLIMIKKDVESASDFTLEVVSRLMESREIDVKLNETSGLLELNTSDPLDKLDLPMIKLINFMPNEKEIEGTIVDIASRLGIESVNQQVFGKMLRRNEKILNKYGIIMSFKRGKNNNVYTIKYDPDWVTI